MATAPKGPQAPQAPRRKRGRCVDGTYAHRFDLGSAPKGQTWPCLRAGCTEVFEDTAPVVFSPSEWKPLKEDPVWVSELRSLGVGNPRGYDEVVEPAGVGIRTVEGDEWGTYSQAT